MITSLSISNFALIEKLTIGFSDGFTIITGETGAGKSIVLGALGLVLGERADLGSLKDKSQKCIIEAQFKLSGYDLGTFFEANNLDYEEMTIIRREILPSGKSRAFINDTPVNLPELQELGNLLIDVHSQHETRELSDNAFQFNIIDSMAGNRIAVASYQNLLKSYKNDLARLSDMKAGHLAALKEHDYNTFLLTELEEAKLKVDEQHELEMISAELSNVEAIRENLERSLALTDNDQFGILKSLKEIRSSIQKVSALSDKYQSLSDRIGSILIEADDIASDLRSTSESLTSDPQKLEQVSQKLELIYNLQKKHHVSTIEELLLIRKTLEEKAFSATSLENNIHILENDIANTASELDAMAEGVRAKRKDAIPGLIQNWLGLLAQLGMPDARFSIDIKPSENYLSNGKDELQLLFAANKGSSFGLLRKVASGGEMSRIMLATKSIMSDYTKLPTIIFDEIDTGVSGEIADRMGEIMKSMSGSMQVLAITHLPQIAAKGNIHFKVFKSTSADSTNTEIRQLDSNERIVEIAQMLSGETVSDSAINHAKALLN